MRFFKDISMKVLRGSLRIGVALLRAAGRPLPEIDGAALVHEARRRTGLEDFGGEVFREPLRRLVASFSMEARLNPIGRLTVRSDLLRLLSNRLELEEDRRRNPEIGSVVIRGPLFIIGISRSGTTFLHNLLEQDPANRVPRTWEILLPSPPPGLAALPMDPRISKAERMLRWFRCLAPGFERIHPLGAGLPEECGLILSLSLLSHQLQTMYSVPSYQVWLEEQGMEAAYTFHKRFLHHLGWRSPGERWVLKASSRLFRLEALLAEYPDARVIMTHRDPLEAIGSLASLCTELRSIFSDEVDPRQVGPEVIRRWAAGLRHGLRIRESGPIPAERFFDLRYPELALDLLRAIRRIYARFDLPLGGNLVDRMRRFLSENPMGKHGRHEYSLERFGLSQEEEKERYRSYREAFGFR